MKTTLIRLLKGLAWLFERMTDALRFLRQRPYLTLTLLSLLNLLLRAIRLSQENYSTRDSESYLAAVEEIGAVGWSAVYSHGIFSSMPPGLFGILRFGDQVGIGAEAAGMFFIALCGIGLIFLVYWGALNVTGSRAYALTAALFTATTPLTVRYGVHILRDLPYWCCAAGFIACGIQGIKKQQHRYFLAAALFMTGAMLFRKEGLELYLAFCFWCAFSLFGDRAGFLHRLRFAVLSFLLVTAVAGTILLPLESFLAQTYGSSWEIMPWVQISYLRSNFLKTLGLL